MNNESSYYENQKLRYEADLVRYRSDLQAWNALSDDKKKTLHRRAEQNKLGLWSLAVAAGASYFLYRFVEHRLTGDTFWIVWGGATLAFVAISICLRKLVGRTARGTVIALIAALVCSTLISVLADNMHKPISKPLGHGIFWTIFAIGLLIEIAGGYHASGAPSAPTPPSKPIY